MSEENINNVYFATPSGTPIKVDQVEALTILQNPESIKTASFSYELATASLDKGTSLDCTYNFEIKATSTKSISNTSYGPNIAILNPDDTYTQYNLSELMSGITYTATFKDLNHGDDQKMYIAGYVMNTNLIQNELFGNTFTITITPKSCTQGFSCNSVQ